MSAAEVEVGTAKPNYTATGRLTGYLVEIRHKGLNEHALLKAPDVAILQNKVNTRLASWTEKWERVVARRDADDQRFKSTSNAQTRTEEAQKLLADLRSLLRATVAVSDVVDWTSLEDHSEFRFAKASEFPRLTFDDGGVPQPPRNRPYSTKPMPVATPTPPQLGLLDRIFTTRREVKYDLHRQALEGIRRKDQSNLDQWKVDCSAIDVSSADMAAEFERAIAAYESEREAFLLEQAKANARVQDLFQAYLSGETAAIVQNCELALAGSAYPDLVKKDFAVNFSPESKTAVVDYSLPRRSDIPTLTKVTYVQSRNEYKESHNSEAERNRLYDDVLYQIALRSIHEIFEADTISRIDAVVFNGWVEDINPATGQAVNGCLLSVQAMKVRFPEINLANVEAKACFRDLKGVSASKLSGMTPIQPILQLERDDRRFVSAYSVTAEVDSGINLAAMDWEDFEHLIRELFEKEFGQPGGEVRVTRASSDGGVDAIAFDPDPIRGGKIVIQAKRYSNTVGVSAVRDLYGTLMNEGANKGILVTTADYGPDAYEFAKGKPISLLSGSNLLFLLEKHGHKARIDLKEAKLVLSGKPFGR